MGLKITTTIILASFFTTLAHSGQVKNTISDSITNHYLVIQKENQIQENRINLLDIDSQDSVLINFNTESNFSLSSNVNKYSTNYERNYVNGVFNANKTLFDYGMNDYAYNAEEFSSKVSILEKESEKEAALFKLLKTSNNIVRLRNKMSELKKSIIFLNKSIDDQKVRFDAGIGTITAVRAAKLLKMDLENQVSITKNKKEINESVFRIEFSLPLTEVDPISSFSKGFLGGGLSCDYTHSDDFARTQKIDENLKKSISLELKKISASSKPHLVGGIKTTLYDINSGVNEYSVSAGLTLKFNLFDGGKTSISQQRAKNELSRRKSNADSIRIKKKILMHNLISECISLKSKLDSYGLINKNLSKKVADAKFKEKIIDTDPSDRINDELKILSNTILKNDIYSKIENIKLEVLLNSEKLLIKGGF